MKFQRDGGPSASRRNRDEESYSEEEEEDDTSSTSVDNSDNEDDDEEEEEEEEEESEEDDSDDDSSEEDVEEEDEKVTKKRPTRNTGPSPGTSSAGGGRKKTDTAKGRLTRQKAKQELPAKRLLRSRKKSPVAGAGSKVAQVFKCQNCKKEFNNKVSLSRHTGWCKQKPSSPRKRKSEGGSTIETPKSVEKRPVANTRVSVVDTPSPMIPAAPRGRGRPRKNPVTVVLQRKNQHRHEIMHHHYHEEVISGVAGTLAMLGEEFSQPQKSPQSSPGVMDTSSEEDYEQKEFAANAHQLISHRSSSASIDVVNPDPPEVTEGPVTCPQCKMTYRTLLGYQNHLPSCAPYSSDEDDEEDEQIDVSQYSGGPPQTIPQFQQHVEANWTDHQTMHETQIAPPPQPPEEPVVITSEEESTSSSDEAVGTTQKSFPNSSISTHQKHAPGKSPKVVQSGSSAPGLYQEISIAPTGVGKSPLKIILPPDNTPQVINAAGLTLERLASPKPKLLTPNSHVRNDQSQRSVTPQQNGPVVVPAQPSHHTPPPPTFHSSVTVHPSATSLSHPQPTYQAIAPAAEYTHPPAVPQVSQSRSSTTSITSLSPSSASKLAPPSSVTTAASLLQQIQAGCNPPTYTQAQLMPGTVLHNSIMQVPQQLTTTTGEAYHLNQPVANQPLPQFPAAQYPSIYSNQQIQSAAGQSTFRVHNGVPGIHPTLPGHPGGGMFIGGNSVQALQQQQAQAAGTMTPVQIAPRHPLPEQQRLQAPQQMSQFATQIPSLPGAIPGQQQQPHPVFTSVNNTIGPYGIHQPSGQVQPHSFAVTPNAPFPQANPQMPNSSMLFPQMVNQQQHQLPNGLLPQQMQHLTVPNGSTSVPTTLESGQQFSAIQQPQQIGQLSGYFQNPASNLTKLPDSNPAQNQQTLPQQVLFNGQQTVSAHPTGLPFPMSQNATSLPHPPHNIQQQPSVPQPMFQQHSVQNPNTGGPTPILQPFPSQAPVESTSQTPEASSHLQQSNSPMINSQVQPQPIANNNLNLQHGQVELNPQQQAQLQQQQQQFLALQQQLQLQQQNSDPNRTPQQSQIQPQTMQAVVVNGMLQWIRTAQPQQMQVPQQQQQFQQGQEQITPSVETATSQQPSTQQSPQNQPAQQGIMQGQPQQPQVIQQLAQVTDSAGNTYLIIVPPQLQQQQNGLAGNNASTANGQQQQLLNLVPGLQGVSCQQQQQVQQRVNSHCTASANGLVSHSPGGSTGNAFHSMGKSSPCPCASCKEKTGTASAMEKYKKVLPYPSPNDSSSAKTISPNIAPKQPISIRPAIPKQPKVVRVQSATAVAPPPRPTIQLTLAHSQQLAQNLNHHHQQPGSQQVKIIPVQQQQQLVGAPVGVGNAPISNPNIAVVRPMENPLQKLSDQISQIESTFLSPPPGAVPVPSQTPPVQQTVALPAVSPQGPRLTLVSSSPPATQPIAVSSISPSAHYPHIITLDPPPPFGTMENSSQEGAPENTQVLNISVPRLTLVDHGIRPATSIASPLASPQISSPGSSIQSISTTPTTPLRNNTANNTSVPSRVKRKVLQVSPSGGGGPSAKSIKLSLHKMENADSYSITKIEGDSNKTAGHFKSLKIKGKIMKGPQKDTATNVVVVPSIRIVANPDPDQNETIAEDSQGLSPRSSDGSSCGGDSNNNGYGARGSLRMTHKAVVMYEVRNESTYELMYQSLNVYAVWDRVFQYAQGTRLNHKLSPVAYPPTNLARPQNDMEAQILFQRLGLTHRALDFMLQTLSQLKKSSESPDSAKARLEASNVTPSPSPLPVTSSEEDPHQQNTSERDSSEEQQEIEVGSESGCARLERFAGRKCFDMFGWLTSKHRDPLTECDAPMESQKTVDAPEGMRYRKLKHKAKAFLVIKKSDIHGRGLFTKRDIEKGEMLIEYAGEVIRPIVCDMREKYYESKAIGCYMFRINDQQVIDATMKGNAARFINHSCEPNCETRTVKINGKDRIIIFAIKRIARGQELSYDYQFDKEEEKIVCTCKSKYCRKYLN